MLKRIKRKKKRLIQKSRAIGRLSGNLAYILLVKMFIIKAYIYVKNTQKP